MARGEAPRTGFTFFLELQHVLPVTTPFIVLDGGMGQSIEIAVRHVEVEEPPPQWLAEAAFADWIDDLASPPASEGQPEGEEPEDVLVPAIRTVAALTRFMPRAAHPRGEDMTVGWLHAQFQLALSAFNEFLETLGFVAGRWEVGPLALRDLPAWVPVLIASTVRLTEGKPTGVTFTAQIHEGLSSTFSGEHLDEQRLAEEAVELHNRALDKKQPYLRVFQFARAARSERLAGNLTRAILDASTAVEMLVSVTIRAGSELLGMSLEETERLDRGGVKRKVREGLSKVLGSDIDIDDLDTAWGRWFSDGYMCRNRAIHEGVSLDLEAADRAITQAADVFAEVKSSLEASDRLRMLGWLLEVDTRTDAPSLAEKPLGISFPWD
jgi:hypothetical protein